MKKLSHLFNPGIFFLLFFIMWGFILPLPVFAVNKEKLSNQASQVSQARRVIIILSTVTIPEMLIARELIEQEGARIELTFPPSAFIANVPPYISGKLKTLDAIKAVSDGRLNPNSFKDYQPSTLDAIDFWNRKLEEKLKPKKKAEPSEEEKLKKPFEDEVIVPKDLPKTKEEKRKKDQEYQKHWKLKKQELLREEQQKKQEGLKEQGKSEDDTFLLFLSTPENEALAVSSSPTLEFGIATGAGFNDTSLYMAGDVAVGVFFQPGNYGNWITSEINTVFTSIVNALNQFTYDEPNAKISFTFKKEVDEITGIPNPLPSSEGTYVNDLRNIYQTHWAYMIIVYKGNGRAMAKYFGPTTWLYSADLRDGYAVRHETMHIFGAEDQYGSYGNGPTQRVGYLRVVNANSAKNDGTGYFAGAGESLPDIMNTNDGFFGIYTRGQVGWWDLDGDGILEPLDTFPDTEILNKTGTDSLTYTGRATDKALINEYGSLSDVTLNTIIAVEYRINQGPWISANPQDGAFDSGIEGFTFTIPTLPIGRYTLEVRATNSVENTEVSFAKDEFTVVQSSITNVPPFAGFTIGPPEGSIYTDFTLDASSSEDDSSFLEVRWDFEDDGIWDTAFSQNKITSFGYATAGTKTIRLEVRDSGGLTHSVTKQVEVFAFNLPPNAFFTVAPQNQYGDANPFTVTLDATGSYDGEDFPENLRVRWDFEDDGVWDTPYSNVLSISHEYPLAKQRIIHIPPHFDFNTEGDAYSVAISGDFAYVADGASGLQNIYIGNPSGGLGRVGNYDTPGYAYSVTLSGNYAYVADGSSGLQIINIANPYHLTLAGFYDTPGRAMGVAVSGNYAYVADGTAGLQIIDITNPSAPFLAGSYDTPSYAVGVAVSGNYAYVADGSSGLQVINITNPATPTLAGSYDTPGFAYDVTILGNYAYVAEGTAGLQIIDITNPSAPFLAGSYDTPGYAMDVAISGNYAYVADQSGGLQIINITNPSAPFSAGSYNTPGYAYGVTLSGNYAYVADFLSLHIADIITPITDYEIVVPISQYWKARLEVVDSNNNTAQATRLIWAVTYDHSPVIEDLSGVFEEGSWDIVGTCPVLTSNNVAISGNYAFATTIDKLKVIDITDFSSPSVVGSYTFSYGDDIGDVAISGNYAYVLSDEGLYTIEITNPSAPRGVGIDRSYYFEPGYDTDISILGNYAYVADGWSKLYIINITNPSTPTRVGNYDTPGYPIGVAVSGNYAYVADYSSGLQVINITNPATPTLAGSYDTPGYAYDVTISGNYAYVADYASGLQIIDITNPSAPTLVGSYDTPGFAYDVTILGNYACVADGTAGLQIIDITNPSAPFLAGSFSGNAYGVTISGKYAYIAGGGSIVIRSVTAPFLKVSIASDDLDLGTTWDGLMEYRWDFNNDLIWDTEFSSSKSVYFPDVESIRDISNIACEVKDRFHATARGLYTIPKIDNAKFISQSVPTTMVAGETYPVSITMKNSGTFTWTGVDYYGLGFQNPQNNLLPWGIGRVDLSDTDSISPTEVKTFNFTVRAPSRPDKYTFQWQMSREYVNWFGEHTPNLVIKVISPPVETEDQYLLEEGS